MRAYPPDEAPEGDHPTDHGDEPQAATSVARAVLRLILVFALVILLEYLTGFAALGPGANDFPGAGGHGKPALPHRPGSQGRPAHPGRCPGRVRAVSSGCGNFSPVSPSTRAADFAHAGRRLPP